jgi:hypothetical protein
LQTVETVTDGDSLLIRGIVADSMGNRVNQSSETMAVSEINAIPRIAIDAASPFMNMYIAPGCEVSSRDFQVMERAGRLHDGRIKGG